MKALPGTNEAHWPPHSCGRGCLGPLAFHTVAVGARLSLSQGARRAERAKDTFQQGLAFSCRPVQVGERIRLRVERSDQHWEGALRLGFTSVLPSCASVPAMALPGLTATPGSWVAPIPAVYAQLGMEVEFWVKACGRVFIEGSDRKRYLLLEGVDVRQELWAVIDVYGQTRAVQLLGSKKGKFWVQRSCPVPPPARVSPGDSCLCVYNGRRCQPRHSSTSQQDPTSPPAGWNQQEDCSVCLSENASVFLPCGHRCLCEPCAVRVTAEFTTCPLCRCPIV
ncbi:E3 ubiquitin-protein ligase NEURL3-like [Megalops cyprinoides]|uniref:E3 ubiquitin-protein ligase NEURL3-like n=1 Tax=Megalops cyprinoides TaxID=118141 RepID=UPI00186455FA|nr:E3 ubiquitin-protein ligase NEURL3-like [Megalops cyprinoides]XP_036385975.1 E3 ubiquitin-protein ligase NEURL3-like [Megalops cyprinoides]